MALNLPNKYPGRFDATSTDYPQGKFKNRTSPTAQDGSYLERDWLNDWGGFFGALLRNAGLTPNETVDTAQSSQFYDAMMAVSRAGSFKNATAVTASSTTLTAAQVGQAFLFTTAASTVALPAASSVTAGGAYKLHTSVGFTLSVTGGGAMQAGNSSVTSLYVPAGTEVLAVSTGVAWWVFGTGQTLSNLGLVGGLRNLKASATGASATVTVTADQIALDSTAGAPPLLVNSVSVSPSLATSGANGLDTGTSATSTWYSVWVISNGTTTAGLLSLSSTSPTMPSGYTYRRRIGWARTDASANKYPLAFSQAGSSINILVTSSAYYPLMASGTAGTLSQTVYTPVPVATTSFAPPTASRILIKGGLTGASTSVVAYSSTQDGWGGWDSITNPPEFLCPDNDSPNPVAFTGGVIYWASNTTTGRLWCVGWEDQL